MTFCLKLSESLPKLLAMEDKNLVNPVALRHCSVKFGDIEGKLLDLSVLRAVVEAPHFPVLEVEQKLVLDFQLDREKFTAPVILKTSKDGRLRFCFDKLPHSAQASLKSFLSCRKIGESITEDWSMGGIRHFHGLSESEFWFDEAGRIVFTYLDDPTGNTQFLIRLLGETGSMRAGRILRKEYLDLTHIEAELPLLPVSDRELYLKLSECRDVITNFRPIGQKEYSLKQKLLKVMSDYLYSSHARIDLSPIRPPKVVTTDMQPNN